MTKDEIISKLKEEGIAHDPSALKADLEALLPVEEPEGEDEEKSNDPPTEEAEETTAAPEEIDLGYGKPAESDGEVTTKSGIVVPPAALKGIEKTTWRYLIQDKGEAIDIYRVDPMLKEEFVRTYSLERHGEDFKQMAYQFVRKNNLKYSGRKRGMAIVSPPPVPPAAPTK